ncbi:MAG: sulfatase-like hydrolase/transferase [Akkermansiaceae bacterium]|nr:sulfatase-like hydrolase/transferase [Akkermansiaceae bacterium]
MRLFYRSFSARLALIAFGLFFCISLLSRLLLTIKAGSDVSWNFSLLGSFFCGAYFDIAAGLFAAACWLLLGLVLPTRFLKTRTAQFLITSLVVIFVSLLIFITTSEWFFWDEFGVRFNFIAVDYLIWTQEVLGNITESYPMGPIMLGIIAIGAGVTWVLRKKGILAWAVNGVSTWTERITGAVAGITLAGLAYLFVAQSSMPIFANQYHSELAKNGCWSFFAAFKKMELDYTTWYPALPQSEALTDAKRLLVTSNETASSQSAEDFHRSIKGRGSEKRWNVVMICMESFGADLMAYTGNTKNLSPNLDQLSNESIFFENLYATGTRTVRGMEALTLNLPPTPGASILYRPEGTNLVTTFTPFLKRGYDCGFFYGGDGKFDYMNRFFSTSGARNHGCKRMGKKRCHLQNLMGCV